MFKTNLCLMFLSRISFLQVLYPLPFNLLHTSWHHFLEDFSYSMRIIKEALFFFSSLFFPPQECIYCNWCIKAKKNYYAKISCGPKLYVDLTQVWLHAEVMLVFHPRQSCSAISLESGSSILSWFDVASCSGVQAIKILFAHWASMYYCIVFVEQLRDNQS